MLPVKYEISSRTFYYGIEDSFIIVVLMEST